MSEIKLKKCPGCQKSFNCYSNNCWCNSYPAIVEIDFDKGCYCSVCLKNKVNEIISEILKNRSKKMDVKIRSIGPAHNPIEGIDYYKNELGQMVFTEWFHLRKGSCCQNGCKHCPY